jgi:catechol 2,3-dioxygenase-like lactoylglutathione lyase family enzyme
MTAIAGARAADYTTQHSSLQEIIMSDASLAFDHVHLVSRDPHAAAAWYVDKLGGRIAKSTEMRGAPQIYVAFGDAMVIVRGERPAESAGDRPGLQWGVDHFGMRVKGDFDAFCAGLKAKGVEFSMEPTDINPATRIAFIKAPDGVSVELLLRRERP